MVIVDPLDSAVVCAPDERDGEAVALPFTKDNT